MDPKRYDGRPSLALNNLDRAGLDRAPSPLCLDWVSFVPDLVLDLATFQQYTLAGEVQIRVQIRVHMSTHEYI